MKNLYKAALLAALGLASVSAVQAATYNGDLLIGFTSTSGNDLVYDLGAASSLTSGETWNLNSLLSGFSLNTVQWGVIGALQTAANNTSRFVWSTTDGATTPQNINGLGGFTPFNTSAKSIYSNFGAAGAGQSLSISAGDDNSWNKQTISPSLSTQWLNVAGGVSPNVTGLTSDTLYQTLANNAAPSVLGNFSLDSSGTVTFTSVAVPEPATYGLVAGAGLLALSMRNKFSRKQA